MKGITDDWKKTIYPLLEIFVERTPGSFIEEKSFALVWHYRKADPELGSLKSKELVSFISADSSLRIWDKSGESNSKI